VCGPSEFHLFSSAGGPSGASTQMAFEVEDLEATLADLRARGVTFERFEMPGFDDRGDTIAAPDNYPSKGTGEIGTFFYDSEGNLIGIAQPVRGSATRG
jgi:catechol 2,3-dioxygenase-like lactoylglutathione lyase family enzyme